MVSSSAESVLISLVLDGVVLSVGAHEGEVSLGGNGGVLLASVLHLSLFRSADSIASFVPVVVTIPALISLVPHDRDLLVTLLLLLIVILVLVIVGDMSRVLTGELVVVGFVGDC